MTEKESVIAHNVKFFFFSSMMCEFSGAIEVTACDGSRAMIDVAHDVLQANGVSDKINLLHKHSSDIKIPSDLPSRY